MGMVHTKVVFDCPLADCHSAARRSALPSAAGPFFTGQWLKTDPEGREGSWPEGVILVN